MDLSENSIRGMDNYDDPAVEGASRGDGASTLGGDLDAAMGLRMPGTGVSQQEVQQMADENGLLRKRLNRRNLLLDAVRKAYIRDVVVVKSELAKSSQKGYQLDENVTKALPSLDLRPWLKLFAPDECTFAVGGVDERHGGHIEIIHRESQKVNQLTAKCEELREIEQEQRIKATMMEVQAQKDRGLLEDQVQKNAEDRSILCAQVSTGALIPCHQPTTSPDLTTHYRSTLPLHHATPHTRTDRGPKDPPRQVRREGDRSADPAGSQPSGEA